MTLRQQRESKIRSELTRLAEVHGGNLHPEVVVEAARDPESPLHASFEWDDSKASKCYRLWQARQLIRAVVTYEKARDGSLVPVPVFVSLSTDRANGGPGYRITTQVLSDGNFRRRLLLDARREMICFKEKYRTLNELAAVFEAMDEAVEGLPLEIATESAVAPA